MLLAAANTSERSGSERCSRWLVAGSRCAHINGTALVIRSAHSGEAFVRTAGRKTLLSSSNLFDASPSA